MRIFLDRHIASVRMVCPHTFLETIRMRRHWLCVLSNVEADGRHSPFYFADTRYLAIAQNLLRTGSPFALVPFLLETMR